MALTEDFQLIRRDRALPPEADFALVLADSAMEPLLHQGQTVYVSCRAALQEGDIGLFLIEGQVFCRRWYEDYNGALVLLGRDEKVCIYLNREQRRRCLCLGKVIF